MPRKLRDLTGQRFGRLTAQRYVGDQRWECVCDCGLTFSPFSFNLLRGRTQSCGCLLIHVSGRDFVTHGLTAGGKPPEYKIWGEIIRRCHNPKSHAFANYGGRGITVCDRWRFGEDGVPAYACFIKDVGHRPNPKMTLDRIDNEQGYSPSNCEWRTRTAQARNRRSTVMITWNGVTMPFAEACEKAGLPYHLVKLRIFQGWSEQRALTEPKHYAPKRKH